MQPQTFLTALGQSLQQYAQDKIDDTTDPPNALSTIARKGSSHPLIDTAMMKNTLTFEVD